MSVRDRRSTLEKTSASLFVVAFGVLVLLFGAGLDYTGYDVEGGLAGAMAVFIVVYGLLLLVGGRLVSHIG